MWKLLMLILKPFLMGMWLEVCSIKIHGGIQWAPKPIKRNIERHQKDDLFHFTFNSFARLVRFDPQVVIKNVHLRFVFYGFSLELHESYIETDGAHQGAWPIITRWLSALNYHELNQRCLDSKGKWLGECLWANNMNLKSVKSRKLELIRPLNVIQSLAWISIKCHY